MMNKTHKYPSSICKIKLIEECCAEAGIDIARNNWDKKAKNNLWKAREQR